MEQEVYSLKKTASLTDLFWILGAVTTIFSLFYVRATLIVSGDAALTGKITLGGKVLLIGSVKEKLLAAYHFGLKTIILRKENEKDLADTPEEVREDLTIHTVDMIDEVLKYVLEKEQVEEIIEPPPIWTTDQTSTDISANVE